MIPQSDSSFKIIKELGAGAFARTCLVEITNRSLKRKLNIDEAVIKIPHDRQKEKALIQELEANASMNSIMRASNSDELNHIVRYLGFESYKERYVIIFEYVKGRDLRKEIRHSGTFELRKSIDIIKQICTGMSVIHKHKILHRDIKPENILLSENGVAKIADLGVSAILNSEERASTTAGTIYYMAPEILIDNKGSFYSDIYSIGIMLYELATGSLPFYGDSIGAIVKEISRGKPTPPISINPQIDPGLNEIILTAISKDVAKRFNSAHDLIHALDSYLNKCDLGGHTVDKAVENAISFYNLGKSDVCITMIEELIVENPENSRLYQSLAEVHSKMFAEENAIAVLKKGTEYCKDCSYLHRDLSIIYYNRAMRSNDKSLYILAASHLEKALAGNLDIKSGKNGRALLNVIRRILCR